MTFIDSDTVRARLFALYDSLNEHIEDQEDRIKTLTSTIKTVESAKIKGEISRLTKILKSVSAIDRLQIILVTNQFVTFNLELEYILELSQTKANHHIQKLINAGIIDKKKEGRINILSITEIGKIFGYFSLAFINEDL